MYFSQKLVLGVIRPFIFFKSRGVFQPFFLYVENKRILLCGIKGECLPGYREIFTSQVKKSAIYRKNGISSPAGMRVDHQIFYRSNFIAYRIFDSGVFKGGSLYQSAVM